MKLMDDTFWLYVTHEKVATNSNIKGRSFECQWMKLCEDGKLTVKGDNPNKNGYAWDGCSPKVAFLDQVWGTPDGVIDPKTEKRKTYYASLFHDVLYQFGVQANVKRKEADRLFLELMKKNNFLWSYFYYVVVRTLGGLFYGRSKEQV